MTFQNVCEAITKQTLHLNQIAQLAGKLCELNELVHEEGFALIANDPQLAYEEWHTVYQMCLWDPLKRFAVKKMAALARTHECHKGHFILFLKTVPNTLRPKRSSSTAASSKAVFYTQMICVNGSISYDWFGLAALKNLWKGGEWRVLSPDGSFFYSTATQLKGGDHIEWGGGTAQASRPFLFGILLA